MRGRSEGHCRIQESDESTASPQAEGHPRWKWTWKLESLLEGEAVGKERVIPAPWSSQSSLQPWSSQSRQGVHTGTSKHLKREVGKVL